MKKQNLIFIHGFRGSALGLKELSEEFDNKKFQVFTPDLPPAGDQTMKEYSARLYARFVANYIKENHIKNPILIGHSMGSLIVAAVAERYPDLIGDKIILLAPITARPNKFFAIISPLAAFLPNKLVGFITTKYLFIPKKNPALLKKALETTYLCSKHFYSRKDVLRSARFASSCAISDFVFDKKVLLLAGEHDKLIPRKKTEQIATNLNIEAVFIENTGHLLNYEAPAKVASEIKKFLKTKK